MNEADISVDLLPMYGSGQYTVVPYESFEVTLLERPLRGNHRYSLLFESKHDVYTRYECLKNNFKNVLYYDEELKKISSERIQDLRSFEFDVYWEPAQFVVFHCNYSEAESLARHLGHAHDCSVSLPIEVNLAELWKELKASKLRLTGARVVNYEFPHGTFTNLHLNRPTERDLRMVLSQPQARFSSLRYWLRGELDDESHIEIYANGGFTISNLNKLEYDTRIAAKQFEALTGYLKLLHKDPK